MNFTDEQIEYIKNASDHVEMLCGGRGQGKIHQLINEMQDKINNLQSKIDKINELLDKLEMQPAYLDCKYYELDGFNELRNVLKEDK